MKYTVRIESCDWAGVWDDFEIEAENEEEAVRIAEESYLDHMWAEYYTPDEEDDDFLDQEEASWHTWVVY